MSVILIPMAGAGSRFVNAGYKMPKPMLPLMDRYTGLSVPMVVAATNDLLKSTSMYSAEIIYIVQDHLFSVSKDEITRSFPKAKFISINSITDGQARTCLLAKGAIYSDKQLLIGACDNGIDVSSEYFEKLKKQADAIIFTFRGNSAVLESPQSYGWVDVCSKENKVKAVSIKKPLSNLPVDDHAIVGTFWFKHGYDFVNAAEIMISHDERINGEFYVDQVFSTLLKQNKCIMVCEVDRYLCWGTPRDYEAYEKTHKYWKSFLREENA